jgi:hypothetical protein
VDTYTAQWTAVIAAVQEVGYESFDVVALANATWASVSDVLNFTGIVVSNPQLLQAQGIIDLACARTYEVKSVLLARDLHWLKVAVVYQAAWMTAQPDLFTRTDITQYTQDGMSAILAPGALTVAPFARMALRRLRWMQSRSIETLSPFERAYGYPLGGAIRDYDDDEPWSPWS